MSTTPPPDPADAGPPAAATVAERAAGRSLAEFLPLVGREEDLRASVKAGIALDIPGQAEFGDTARRIRGRFLRFLILGGDPAAPVHENGIDLAGAWIDGPVALDNVVTAVFVVVRRCAIDALTATDATLPGFALTGSRIAGKLDAARLACPAGVYWDAIVADGPVRLDDARIQLLLLDGARLRAGLRAQRLTCAGGIYLRAGFRADAPVDLLLASAGNDIDCGGGTFVSPLVVVDAEADTPAIRPLDPVIRNEIAAQRAAATRLARRRGEAAPESLATQDAMAAILVGDVPDAKFDAARTAVPALQLGLATAKGRLLLGGASCFGQLGAATAHFGDVAAPGASLRNPDGPALDLGGTTIDRSLQLVGAQAIDGAVELRGASAAILQVEAGDAWAGRTRFNLDGFAYQRLDIQNDAASYARFGVRWIKQLVPGEADPTAARPGGRFSDEVRRTWARWRGKPADLPEFRPQPWDQLIAVLRASGHPSDATRLAVAKEDEYRRAGKVGLLLWPWHWAHGALVRYGYEPERLASWLVGLWFVAALIYAALGPAVTHDPALLVPTKAAVAANCLVDRVVTRSREPCRPVADAPEFDPWAYSFDLLVPGGHPGDADEWKLNWHQPSAVRTAGATVVFILTWLERIAGGAGFSVLAVIVGGYLLKRRE